LSPLQFLVLPDDSGDTEPPEPPQLCRLLTNDQAVLENSFDSRTILHGMCVCRAEEGRRPAQEAAGGHAVATCRRSARRIFRRRCGGSCVLIRRSGSRRCLGFLRLLCFLCCLR